MTILRGQLEDRCRLTRLNKREQAVMLTQALHCSKQMCCSAEACRSLFRNTVRTTAGQATKQQNIAHTRRATLFFRGNRRRRVITWSPMKVRAFGDASAP